MKLHSTHSITSYSPIEVYTNETPHFLLRFCSPLLPLLPLQTFTCFAMSFWRGILIACVVRLLFVVIRCFMFLFSFFHLVYCIFSNSYCVSVSVLFLVAFDYQEIKGLFTYLLKTSVFHAIIIIIIIISSSSSSIIVNFSVTVAVIHSTVGLLTVVSACLMVAEQTDYKHVVGQSQKNFQ